MFDNIISEDIKMGYEQPSIEDAINYIADFGGYEKAWTLRSRACFLTAKEYYYHKDCLFTFIEWFGEE